MARTRIEANSPQRRRVAVVDTGGLLVATFLIVGGILAVLRPTAVFVPHPAHGRFTSDTAEALTPQRTRLYGIVAIAAGTGFGALLLWGIRRSLPR
jgi:hypothetical protein